jgi:hypothetical protein
MLQTRPSVDPQQHAVADPVGAGAPEIFDCGDQLGLHWDDAGTGRRASAQLVEALPQIVADEAELAGGISLPSRNSKTATTSRSMYPVMTKTSVEETLILRRSPDGPARENRVVWRRCLRRRAGGRLQRGRFRGR